MGNMLFRGKIIDETCLKGKWMEGQPLYDGIAGKYYIHMYGNSLNESDKAGEEGLLRFIAYEVDPETICQYTGLTDKDGKKIYEWDIVQEYPFRAVVRFGEFENLVLKNIGFNLEWINRIYYRQDLLYWADKIEVTGNIFDNPELLSPNQVKI